MKRHQLLDGLRGYFLLFMLLNHLWFEGGNPIALVNHNQLGFVEDAQGVILISGLIVGLYYGRLHSTGRGAEAVRRLRARIPRVARAAARASDGAGGRCGARRPAEPGARVNRHGRGTGPPARQRYRDSETPGCRYG